jgi:hypothetical protein
MIWPHQLRFPHRIMIMVLGCVLAGLIGSLWPGLQLSERALMPVFTVYGIASGFFTYGLLLMLVRFVPSIHNVLALVLFYGALASLFVFLIQVAIGSASTASPYDEAVSFTFTVSVSVGTAAASFSALNSHASPSNNRWRGP